ncbi:hypothetical protein ACFLS1_08110, partial [Verrucomicrobiota bacterium]
MLKRLNETKRMPEEKKSGGGFIKFIVVMLIIIIFGGGAYLCHNVVQRKKESMRIEQERRIIAEQKIIIDTGIKKYNALRTKAIEIKRQYQHLSLQDSTFKETRGEFLEVMNKFDADKKKARKTLEAEIKHIDRCIPVFDKAINKTPIQGDASSYKNLQQEISENTEAFVTSLEEASTHFMLYKKTLEAEKDFKSATGSEDSFKEKEHALASLQSMPEQNKELINAHEDLYNDYLKEEKRLSELISPHKKSSPEYKIMERILKSLQTKMSDLKSIIEDLIQKREAARKEEAKKKEQERRQKELEAKRKE